MYKLNIIILGTICIYVPTFFMPLNTKYEYLLIANYGQIHTLVTVIDSPILLLCSIVLYNKINALIKDTIPYHIKSYLPVASV